MLLSSFFLSLRPPAAPAMLLPSDIPDEDAMVSSSTGRAHEVVLTGDGPEDLATGALVDGAPQLLREFGLIIAYAPSMIQMRGLGDDDAFGDTDGTRYHRSTAP